MEVPMEVLTSVSCPISISPFDNGQPVRTRGRGGWGCIGKMASEEVCEGKLGSWINYQGVYGLGREDEMSEKGRGSEVNREGELDDQGEGSGQGGGKKKGDEMAK